MNDQLDKVSKYAEKKLSLGRRDIPRARAYAPEGEGQVSSPGHWVHSQWDWQKDNLRRSFWKDRLREPDQPGAEWG